MTTLTEGPRTGEHIVSEANGLRSREQIVVDNGADLVAGAVIAVTETSTATVAAGTPVSGSGGTVGNGAVGTWTADAGAKAGVWTIRISNPATDLGKFIVYDPDGLEDGVGTVGTAYNGKINGTLADGSADWVEDDYIPITVSYATPAPKWKELDTTATNGLQIAAGILYRDAAAASAEVDSVAHVRDSEVNYDMLTWPSGISAANKQIAVDNLKKVGIITR